MTTLENFPTALASEWEKEFEISKPSSDLNGEDRLLHVMEEMEGLISNVGTEALEGIKGRLNHISSRLQFPEAKTKAIAVLASVESNLSSR